LEEVAASSSRVRKVVSPVLNQEVSNRRWVVSRVRNGADRPDRVDKDKADKGKAGKVDLAVRPFQPAPTSRLFNDWIRRSLRV
jgi:hypothetical protein